MSISMGGSEAYMSIPMSKSSSSSSNTSIPMSKSSSSSSNTSILTSKSLSSSNISIPMSKSFSSSNTASSPSKMNETEGLEIQPFLGIEKMRNSIRIQYNMLNAGSTNQYIAFSHVTKAILAEIDAERSYIGKYTRMTHYIDTDHLIVRIMPSSAHEVAHANLVKHLIVKMTLMGISLTTYDIVNATAYKGNRSSKEGDSAIAPLPAREGDADLPTIVFEAGLSESLSRLRNDADWWLQNGKGDVKIVIIISIIKAQLRVHVEKWELAQPDPGWPNTRSNALISTLMQTITIDPTTVEGAPLVLEFEKIFLRPATPPEADFVFTAAELLTWSASIRKRLE